jgi:hypothetical protein
MLRRRQINGGPRGRSLRLLRSASELVRWPFERAVWAIERSLLWPLRERLAGRSPDGRRAGVAALGGVALAAVAVGLLVLALSGGGSHRQVAETTRVALATPESQPQAERPSGPVLHGAPPRFAVGEGTGVAQADAGAAPELNAAGAETPAPSGDEAAGSEEVTATASSSKPVPAGPAAMKVARRFSNAFVFYEIGERPARAKAVFRETATPQLATALGERPPRLPAGAKVPKARVVNLVPGPRAGKAYTVSVSLLRLGLTSELRLELNRKKSQWLVTDVRG